MTKIPLRKERELIEEVMVEMKKFGALPGVDRKKNAKDSIEYRQKGNELFNSRTHNWKKHERVLDYYSKSVALAPNSSEELALAYGNRSALLFHLGKYAECIQDCDLALDTTVNDNLEAKLLYRKAECLAALKDSSATEVIKNALLVLEKMTTLDDKVKKLFIEKLSGILKNVSIVNDEKETKDTEQDSANDRTEIANVELPTFDRQKEAPCASDAITIAYNKQWGRHLVATRDIDPGEILVVEESCYHFVFPNGMYVLCSHCAKYAWSSIPCKHCIFGVYCSENCRAEAWDKYHKFECEVFGDVWDIGEDSKSNTCSIRFFLMLIHEAGSIDKLRNHLIKLHKNKDLRTRGFTAEGTFPDKKCISLLSASFNLDKYDSEMKESYAMTAAAALCIIANKTTFFGKKVDIKRMDSDTWDDFLFTGALLTRCFMVIPRVCFPLKEYHFGDLQVLDYGFIAHPLCTLINHSCDPNVLRIKTSNNEAIIYAKYPIKKDQQLFVSYSETFLEAPKFFRQAQIKEVHKFTCACLACEKNWAHGEETLPLSTSITKKHPKIKEELSKELNQKDVLKIFQTMLRKNYTFDPEIVKILIKMHKSYAEKITVHCSDFKKFTKFLFNIYQRAFGSFNTMPDRCLRHSG